MARFLRLARFFRVVAPVPPLMTLAVLAGGAFGVLVVAVNPARAGAVLTPILLLQVFASASGFMVPARRGHYDLLLTQGDRPSAIAAMHWAVSVAPGIASWLVTAFVEVVATGGTHATLLRTGTIVAIVLVSTVPWAVTIALPRFAGAVGWLVGLAFVSALTPAPRGPILFESLDAGSWPEAAIALTLYPPLLVGRDLSGATGLLALPALMLGAGALAWALVWVGGRDIPLEAAQ